MTGLNFNPDENSVNAEVYFLKGFSRKFPDNDNKMAL